MILYTFRRCPYAIRARLILQITGIVVDTIEVDLKNKPKSLMDISPKGTVPVLVIDNGTVIDESIAIVDWALLQHYPKDWLLLSHQDIKKGDDLLDQLHRVFIPSLNRYKYATRYQSVDLEKEEEIIIQYLTILNNALKDYLLGSKPSKYDVAIFPFIRQANIANASWLQMAQYQNLHEWYISWSQNINFLKIMEKK